VPWADGLSGERTAGSGSVKLDEEVADRAVVSMRPRPKFFPVRDPAWREDVAIRVGIPALGAVVAAAFAWMIAQL
jgi:hypothetical protein